MLYYIFHNPHSPTQMSLDRYWDFKTPDGLPTDNRDTSLIRQGRATFFNPHNTMPIPSSIIVKPCNLLLLDLPSLETFSDYQYILKLAYTYWKAGKLHSFDLADYPELFV
jgi:hypothetical protein